MVSGDHEEVEEEDYDAWNEARKRRWRRVIDPELY
jgi:hypothetical protein